MRTTTYALGLSVFLAGPFALAGCSDDDNGDAYDDLDPIEATEVSDLLQLREEEKLARDVYLTLYDTWGTQVFENISGAEQSHMDQVGDLIEAYGLEDPITDDSVGVFQNPTLDALYDQLVEAGQLSEPDALLVGATIEDLDIYDIRAMRHNTDNADIIAVYDSLECGSNKHMQAFTRQLDNLGLVYEAQFLTEEEIQEVLANDESCGGDDHDHGDGGGGGGH